VKEWTMPAKPAPIIHDIIAGPYIERGLYIVEACIGARRMNVKFHFPSEGEAQRFLKKYGKPKKTGAREKDR